VEIRQGSFARPSDSAGRAAGIDDECVRHVR
jgi:hypothetical protein